MQLHLLGASHPYLGIVISTVRLSWLPSLMEKISIVLSGWQFTWWRLLTRMVPKVWWPPCRSYAHMLCYIGSWKIPIKSPIIKALNLAPLLIHSAPSLFWSYCWDSNLGNSSSYTVLFTCWVNMWVNVWINRRQCTNSVRRLGIF